MFLHQGGALSSRGDAASDSFVFACRRLFLAALMHNMYPLRKTDAAAGDKRTSSLSSGIVLCFCLCLITASFKFRCLVVPSICVVRARMFYPFVYPPRVIVDVCVLLLGVPISVCLWFFEFVNLSLRLPVLRISMSFVIVVGMHSLLQSHVFYPSSCFPVCFRVFPCPTPAHPMVCGYAVQCLYVFVLPSSPLIASAPPLLVCWAAVYVHLAYHKDSWHHDQSVLFYVCMTL